LNLIISCRNVHIYIEINLIKSKKTKNLTQSAITINKAQRTSIISLSFIKKLIRFIIVIYKFTYRVTIYFSD